jgi:hypothetical protein
MLQSLPKEIHQTSQSKRETYFLSLSKTLLEVEELPGGCLVPLNRKKIRRVGQGLMGVGNSSNVEKVKIYKSKIEEELRK